MYLKRLEIQGFKSFAKKTVLEFEPGITAIVGPNGSGKSIVADSLRWVLGEQSTKLLRGKKSDDVIFAGSDKKIKLGFAEVFATFDNRDHKIPIDVAEVSIGRRVDRSGESEYLINGNRVRLLDIVDLVLKSNIGTSRYTVIGQGTIDQMILAGPSEIKSLLDEASGVKGYYNKREKTLRRLEQTAQNLIRAQDLAREIEPRLKSLRRQAKRMEARSEIELELKALQHQFYNKQYWELNDKTTSLGKEVAEFQAKRKELETQIATFRKQLEEFESSAQKKLGGFAEEQQAVARLQEQKNRLLEQESLIRGKMESQKGAKGDPKTLELELHSVTQKLLEAESGLAKQTEEAESLRKKITDSAENLRALNVKLDELYQVLANPAAFDAKEVVSLLEQTDALVEDLMSSIADSGSIEEASAKALAFRDQFKKLSGSLKGSVKEVNLSGPGMQDQLKKLQQEKDVLNDALNALNQDLSRRGVIKQFLENEKGQQEKEKLRLELELKNTQSGGHDQFVAELVKEEARVKGEASQIAAQIEKAEAMISSAYEAEAKEKAQLGAEEKRVRTLMDELSALRDAESKVEVEKAKFDTQEEALIVEITNELGHDGLAALKAERKIVAAENLPHEISKIKRQLELIGGVDDLTIKEYEETETRYGTLTKQIEDLDKGMADSRQIMDELDEHIKTAFNTAFHKVNEKFEQYFRSLFNGGVAHLSLVKAQEAKEEAVEEGAEAEGADDQLRPEEKIVQKYEHGASNIVGVDIKATPPGKKLSAIQALSGGERSLTAIALLCSLLSCFPSPFVVLDEVDAALDEANTIRFGQILGTLAHQTQFITITHNRETMSQSNAIYGVTMGDDGISKLLSIKFDQAAGYAK